MSTIDDKGANLGACLESWHARTWMKKALVAGFVTAAAGLGAPLAWGANADSLTVNVEVKPVNDTGPIVSLSRPDLPTFISVKLLVTNGGINTINNVSITGSTTVSAGASGDVARFSEVVNLQTSAPSPTCAPSAASLNTVVTCSLGQLASQETRHFFLIFAAPSTGTTVKFHAQANFSSGNSDQTPPAMFQYEGLDPSNNVSIALTVPSDFNKKVKTVLPPDDGGLFSTGIGKDAGVSSQVPFSTKVEVPGGVGFVTENSIEQDDVTAAPNTCYDGLIAYRCYFLATNIDVKKAETGAKIYLNIDAPSASPAYLTIWLRQDISTLGAKPYPDVTETRLFYTSSVCATPVLIKSCTAVGGPWPKPDIPCVASQTSTIKGNKGYHLHEIRAKENGRIGW